MELFFKFFKTRKFLKIHSFLKIHKFSQKSEITQISQFSQKSQTSQNKPVQRLGYYLFTRAKRRGDKRFDKYETNWWGMTVPFVLQIVWVYVMLLPTLILNELDNPGITVCSYIG